MDIQRAREILKAPETIQVQLEGQGVWIDGVDEGNGTVQVHPLNDPSDIRQVGVERLREIQ